MTGGVTDRRRALDDKFAAHKYLGAVGILVTVEKFARNGAAEVLDPVYITIDSPLEHFINDLKIPGQVCPF